MNAHAPIIQAENLRKCYRIRETGGGGLRAPLRALLRPRHSELEAVRGITFRISPGERVAFVGPNGAGKSTTLKMLSGILYPTSGTAAVAGMVPWEQRAGLSRVTGTVFGQRSQLWYHLPPADTFNLLAQVYGMDHAVYVRRRSELEELFGLRDLVHRPVRHLSLGERMRCEIAATLLHGPRVLFLDEPTIGLDVTAKAVIRQLVRRTSESEGMTVLLTSHDTGDIEGVCRRVVIINQGELLMDRDIGDLRRDYIRKKIVTVQCADEQAAVSLPGVGVLRSEPYRAVLEVDLSRTGVENVVEALLKRGGILDLTIEDPPLEEIIKQIYADGRGPA